jgi:hypothetical protein
MPESYSIEDLLNSGVQPFPDLPDEDLAQMGRSIGKGPLPVPVVIGTDGTLIDGHQRLKSMAARGRKRIDAGDVRVIDGCTRENALDWAVKLNAAGTSPLRRRLSWPASSSVSGAGAKPESRRRSG